MSTFDKPFSATGRTIESGADEIRNFYGFPPGKVVTPEELAGCMPVEFRSPAELKSFPRELLEDIQVTQSAHWDAITLPIPIAGRFWVFMNEDRSPKRMRITKMEELLHIHFGHRPTTVSTNSSACGGCTIRTYNKAEESQAYSIGAALLVPWKSICFAINRGVQIALLAEQFGVSDQLILYRINTTGLSRLHKNRSSTRVIRA